MNRAIFLLPIYATLLFSCMRAEQLDVTTKVGSELPMQVSVSTTPFTKGTIVYSYENMVSMGVFCAFTGNEEWSTDTKFTKLDNRRFTISNDGSWEIDGSPEYWGYSTLNDMYTIYGYSPHSDDIENITPRIEDGELAIDYTVAASSINQPDLMFSIPQKDITPQNSGSVELVFQHALSCVYFSVKTTMEDVRITDINVTGVIDSGTLKWDYKTDSLKWEYKVDSLYLTLGDLSKNVFSVEIDNYTLNDDDTARVNTDRGYLMMIPQVLSDEAKVTLTLNTGETKEMTMPTNIEWEAGMRYHYILNLEEEECDYIFSSTEVSNCYIINPTPGEETIVQIPIENRINDFWQNYSGKGYDKISKNSETSDFDVILVWEDFDKTLKFDYEIIDDEDDKMAVLFNFGADYQEGNFVFCVRDITDLSDIETLWSWHLWFTDYNPDVIAAKNKNNIIADTDTAYTADGYNGAVHRYIDAANATGSSAVWSGVYKDKFIMDRNIGERDCKGTGTVYYQFGRKDPFPSSAGATYIANNTQPISRIASGQTYIWSVTYCINFFIPGDNSSENWCGETAARLLSCHWFDGNITNSNYSEAKSIFDPSPLGWKIPVTDTWSWFNGVKSDSTAYYSTKSVGKYYYYGYRDKGQYGSVYQKEGMGYVWSSNPWDWESACSFSYCNDAIQTPSILYVDYGLPIRPIQE